MLYSPQMVRKTYIWQRDSWPSFTWDAERLLVPLGDARREQGAFAQQVAALGFSDRLEAELQALSQEVTDTSKIEGENLDYATVRSSVARRLGMEYAAVLPDDVRAAGVVDMMLDATKNCTDALTETRLLHWHTGLFPIVDGRRPDLAVGQWRTDAHGPMQVVSGRVDAPNVHFEAPPAQRIPREIAQFLKWFGGSREMDGLLRSAIAHLWFVTLHPFEDGNGRVARAIADMALAQDDRFSQRFFSMSRQILVERHAYYNVLEHSQTGDLDVTEWLLWYLGCYVQALRGARAVLADVLRAARFWTVHSEVAFSDRQRKVLNRFLHQFEGNLTARKWAGITHTSQDTAARDLNDLVAKGVLVRNSGGSKNTSYSLAPLPA